MSTDFSGFPRLWWDTVAVQESLVLSQETSYQKLGSPNMGSLSHSPANDGFWGFSLGWLAVQPHTGFRGPFPDLRPVQTRQPSTRPVPWAALPQGQQLRGAGHGTAQRPGMATCAYCQPAMVSWSWQMI